MLRDHARVVVIGGGIVGCSLAYHIAKAGWTDCVLIEKGELTSGSTWHAAGAITHSLANATIARIAGYGIELYRSLERETGQSVSWHPCGSLRLAYTRDELDLLQYILSVGRALGHPMEIIGPKEIEALHPFYRSRGIVAALHTPADGHVDPAGAAFAFAAGARQHGAQIVRHNRVLDIKHVGSREWRVATELGDIRCEYVVNAGGAFARQIAQWIGVDLPVVCAAHQYLVTEPIPQLEALENELPLVRDGHGIAAYFRQEQSSLLVGFYEKTEPHLVWRDGVPWTSDSELFSPDLDSIMPSIEVAIERLPLLREVGIRRVVNGAIPYTPDGMMLLGPAPGSTNYWCACGVSVGIAWGPGVGKFLAQWMIDGAPDINMRPFDPRRFGAWATYEYAIEKVREDYVMRHEIPFPGRDRPAARPVRHSTLLDRLKARGAVFEQMFGWERPLWFARDGVPRAHVHSFRRSVADRMVEYEVRAVRERVGILDLSGFGKIDVCGRDAARFLDRLTTNRLPLREGGIVLTYVLNGRGTIEAELTCTQLAAEHYFLLFAALDEIRVLDWLAQHRHDREDVSLTNLSDDFGCLVLAGPRSRQTLGRLTDIDLSNASFRWLMGREIDVAGCRVRALRVSLVGELAWELHAPMRDLPALYDALRKAGEPFGIEDFGTAALNAMRFEKAFKGTRELNGASALAQADMMRFAKLDKGDFVGRRALIQNASAIQATRCVYLDVDTGDSDCHGSEAVYRDGRVVGSVSSGAFGPSTQRSLAFAFVEPDCACANEELQVMVLGEMRRATVMDRAAYDPTHQRIQL